MNSELEEAGVNREYEKTGVNTASEGPDVNREGADVNTEPEGVDVNTECEGEGADVNREWEGVGVTGEAGVNAEPQGADVNIEHTHAGAPVDNPLPTMQNLMNQLMYHAAESGKLETVKFLSEVKGADVNWTYKGQIPHTKDAGQSGQKLGKQKTFCQTILMGAAIEGNLECVQFLIKAGADVNHTGTDMNTALAFAAYVSALDCLKLITEAGADVNNANKFGVTPLMCAACPRQTQENRGMETERPTDLKNAAECVSQLLKAGADVKTMLTTSSKQH